MSLYLQITHPSGFCGELATPTSKILLDWLLKDEPIGSCYFNEYPINASVFCYSQTGNPRNGQGSLITRGYSKEGGWCCRKQGSNKDLHKGGMY